MLMYNGENPDDHYGGSDYEDYTDVNSFALHPRSGGDRTVSEKKKLDHPFTEQHFWGSVTYTSYSTQKKTTFVPKTKYTKSIIYYGTPTFKNNMLAGYNALCTAALFASMKEIKNKKVKKCLTIFNVAQKTYGWTDMLKYETFTKGEIIGQSRGF